MKVICCCCYSFQLTTEALACLQVSDIVCQMQRVLTVFRTQRISRLTVHLDSSANTLLLVVHADNGKHQQLHLLSLFVHLQQSYICNLGLGLQKQYTLPCLEAEILQATVDKDMFPTFLLAEAGELNRYYREM